MKQCPACNADMDDHESVCPQCGHGLKEYAERKAKTERTRRENAPTIDLSDLAAAWPAMSASARRHALRARMLGADRSLFARMGKMLGFAWRPAPPSARRVAARAMAMAAVVARGFLEQHSKQLGNADKRPAEWFATLKGLGVAGELERQERDFLIAPYGGVDKMFAARATWRAEGLAVLAWALGRFDLPAYDAAVVPSAVQDSVGFANPEAARGLLASGVLRPASEIDRFATHSTLVSWRLRTFRMSPGPWDFVGHLRRQGSYKETWLEGLRIVDDDLAIGERSIVNAAAEEVERCERIAVERQIAAYWLQGDASVYSKVDPATLLSAC